jgi:DNA-directed RNA polymerase sigma subunit (sigma70/sigma32)
MSTQISYKQVSMKPYLSTKRAEIIWALRQQDYTLEDIGDIFNISRQRVHTVCTQMPDGWKSPWIKIK